MKGAFRTISPLPREKMCVAVDLTPILPGGENGGAKVMVLNLLQEMARMAPNLEFLLLTSGQNHEELGGLETPTMHRWLVRPDVIKKKTAGIPFVHRWSVIIGQYLRTRLSPAVLDQLKTVYRTWITICCEAGF